MSEVNLQHIDFKYPKGEQIFRNLTLKFSKGDFVFLLGANGSGKSTLLKLLLKSISPQKGEIHFSNYNSKVHLSSFIGYVPQSYSLDPEMHVSDTLRFMGSLHHLFGNDLKQRIDFLVESLGMGSILSKKVKQLSGGQKQLTNIALGLIHDPQVVLLDEPFVGLDYKIKSNILSTLKSLNKTRICVTHDMEIAENYADKIVLLEKGKVIENDEPKKLILSNPYYNYEIRLKSDALNMSEYTFSDRINFSMHQNTIYLSFPVDEKLKKEVDDFENENASLIASVKVDKNSLKSTIIGLHKLQLSERNVDDKKGKGKGRGKNKKNK